MYLERVEWGLGERHDESICDVIERSLVMSKGEGLGHEAGVRVKEKTPA